MKKSQGQVATDGLTRAASHPVKHRIGDGADQSECRNGESQPGDQKPETTGTALEITPGEPNSQGLSLKK